LDDAKAVPDEFLGAIFENVGKDEVEMIQATRCSCHMILYEPCRVHFQAITIKSFFYSELIPPIERVPKQLSITSCHTLEQSTLTHCIIVDQL
jgi:hypothetical protein